MRLRLAILAAAFAAAAIGEPPEQPVGLVLSAGGSKLQRAHTETLVSARIGDLIFSGDALKTEADPTTFLFCPARQSNTLGPAGEALFSDKQLKIKSGKLTDQKPVGSCFLPQTVRVALASQQHYGVSLTRGLKPASAMEREKLTPEVAAEVTAFDATLRANPNDQASRIALAGVFEKYKLYVNAVEEYRTIGQQWPDAIWVKSRIFDLDEKIALAEPPAYLEGGKTYALLVGISKYQKLDKSLWLNYAHSDALTMAEHFRSPRGGSLPPENLVVLTDEKATTSAVRNAFETFLKARAGKKDTVFILIAGHGTVETPGSKKAYIITHDADPQDLASTALPMSTLQSLVEQDLSKVGRVVLFVDVCRAGAIGALRGNTVNATVEKLAEAEGEMFMMLASRTKELSLEGAEFGGGHGAFSYALLKGLAGAADKNNDGVVNVNELIAYVRDKVSVSTNDKQHPRDLGNMDNSVPLSDVKKPGIELAHWRVMHDSRSGEPLLLASNAEQDTPLSDEVSKDVAAFQSALTSRPEEALKALRVLEKRVSPERYLQFENQLRVALEDRAQQVLLAYLAGDQTPPKAAAFETGARLVKAASLLTPESLYLQARQAFFEGRSTLFTKDFARATERLEQAVRIDPSGAYSYNALGIGYLEQADFPRAVAAFRDASRRAPHWSYPLHNLAVASVEMGDYKTAIRSYQEAMRQTPDYFYLPYNLGLLYQRMNRNRDAEASYKKAIALAPEAAEPYNAMGSLRASEGKRGEAEKLYQQSIEKNPESPLARHNLALLLIDTPQGIALLQENLKRSPEFFASRLSLAEVFAKRGEIDNAIREYREVVRLKPGYTAAHEALGELLDERNADLEARLGNKAEAQRLYNAVLERTQDQAVRKRVRGKLSR